MPGTVEDDRSGEESPHAVDSFSDIDDLDDAIGDFARALGRSPELGPAPAVEREVERLREPSELRDEPMRIGRYTVVRRIGSGGMGVVYAAYDEDLDRRVAIKLVRGSSATRGPEASARLRREAQALARVSHPNVIAVHEVGEHHADGDETSTPLVFIAMEFVRGKTLNDWCLDAERSSRAVLDVLVQVGRGLVAVHEVGIVHRDIKPQNVMIDDVPESARATGRVRLMDFGLARGDVEESLPSLDGTSGSVLTSALTRTGALVGTPAYMAPEQFDGATVGPAADQFAFCVMAWEALYGERPFAGDTLERLIANVTAGRRRDPPAKSRVPPHVRRALARGLLGDPNARWPDVATLLHELARDPTRRWRTIGALSIAGAASAFAIVRAGPGTDCRDREAQLRTWNDPARAAVHDALVATGAPYAEDAWTRVESGLDAYADAWMTVQIEACERAQPTDELRTAQVLCIEHRRQALVALVDVLANANEVVAEKAVQAVAGLPSPSPCADVEYLAAAVRPPDDDAVASQVETLRQQLGRARALDDAGEYDEGFEIAESVLAEARRVEYAPLLAESLLQVGRLADSLSRYDVAEAQLREAHSEAVASGHDEVAAEAAIRLVHVVGHQLARHDDGIEWGFLAQAEIRRIGATDAREAALLHNLGTVHQTRGEYDEALALYRRALEIREKEVGTDHPSVARTLDAIGAVHRMRGEYDDAIAAYQRALEVRERISGPEHPGVGASLAGLGAVYFEKGDYDEAIAHYQRALTILENALGPNHARVAALVGNLGVFHERRGDHDEALALHERTLAIERATVGPEHPDVAISLENIGNVHYARGHYDEAVSHYRRALAIREKALGPDHPHVGISLANLGQAHMALGEYEDALPYFQRVLASHEKTLGPDNPSVGDALENIGNVYLRQERFADAQEYHRRALAIRERSLGPNHRDVANSLTNLGNVAEARHEYDEALAFHERALAIYETALGPDHLAMSLALYNIGQTRFEQGDANGAVAPLERALSIRERGDGPDTDVADVEFLLARALVRAGRERDRAIGLAGRALEKFREPAHTQEAFAEVEAWLGETKRRTD